MRQGAAGRAGRPTGPGGSYFVPSYLGSKGWVGIDLAPGASPDWDEIPALLEQAWRMTAPTAAVRAYDLARGPGS